MTQEKQGAVLNAGHCTGAECARKKGERAGGPVHLVPPLPRWVEPPRESPMLPGLGEQAENVKKGGE